MYFNRIRNEDAYSFSKTTKDLKGSGSQKSAYLNLNFRKNKIIDCVNLRNSQNPFNESLLKRSNFQSIKDNLIKAKEQACILFYFILVFLFKLKN